MNRVVNALVPMKGHSERVPNKNIRSFSGKPLFYWVINALINTDLVHKIYVDTDSSDIKKGIEKYFGNEIVIIDRLSSLCGDDVSMNKIVNYDINAIDGEYFLQTHTTNPLIDSQTIDAAIEKFFLMQEEGYDSLFSVTNYKSRFYTSSGAPMNHDPEVLCKTQDLEAICEENSNLYVFSRESFNKKNRRIGNKPYFFEMNKMKAIDIDDEDDFNLAELVHKYNQI